MSGPSITQLRDAIAARLKANLTGVRTIEGHGGTFTLDDVKRFAVAAPGVFVAIPGCGAVERHVSQAFILPVHVACVVLTRDEQREGSRRVARDQAAMALASSIMAVVAGHRFNLDGVFAPEELKSVNEYSGAVDKTGVALWQVTWTQPVLLGDSADDVIAALSEIWINGEEFTPGFEPENESPLGNPFNAPLAGAPQHPAPGEIA